MNVSAPRTEHPVFEDHDPYLEARPFVLVPRLVSALRRRWRVWMAIAGSMVALAVLMSLAYPPSFAATAVVLLRQPDGVDPAQAVLTETALVKNSAVAKSAVALLGARSISPDELVGAATAVPVTNEVLKITVTGPTATAAMRRANAVANAFLQFRRELRLKQAQAIVDVIEERRNGLSGELVAVKDEIARSPSDAPGLADLAAREATLTTRITELGRRIEDVTLNAKGVQKMSRVVDAARLAPRSPVRAIATNVVAGAVAGVALGAGVVVVGEIATDRVRRREDVAAALKARVAVSTGPLRGRPCLQRHRMREHSRNPRPDLARAVEHLRRQLVHGGSQCLVVLSVDSSAAAGLMVGLLAEQLVDEGRNVLVADMSFDTTLAELFSIPRKTSTIPSRATSSTITIAFPLITPIWRDEALSDGRGPSDPFDVVLALSDLDPAVGGGHLQPWANACVAVVTAGRSTPPALRAAAQMVRAVGIELESAILVGAGHDDETAGVVPAPLSVVQPFGAVRT